MSNICGGLSVPELQKAAGALVDQEALTRLGSPATLPLVLWGLLTVIVFGLSVAYWQSSWFERTRIVPPETLTANLLAAAEALNAAAVAAPSSVASLASTAQALAAAARVPNADRKHLAVSAASLLAAAAGVPEAAALSTAAAKLSAAATAPSEVEEDETTQRNVALSSTLVAYFGVCTLLMLWYFYRVSRLEATHLAFLYPPSASTSTLVQGVGLSLFSVGGLVASVLCVLYFTHTTTDAMLYTFLSLLGVALSVIVGLVYANFVQCRKSGSSVPDTHLVCAKEAVTRSREQARSRLAEAQRDVTHLEQSSPSQLLGDLSRGTGAFSRSVAQSRAPPPAPQLSHPK